MTTASGTQPKPDDAPVKDPQPYNDPPPPPSIDPPPARPLADPVPPGSDRPSMLAG